MKKMILGAFAAMALVACGGGDPCTATSKCSAQPKKTDAEIASCQASLKDGAKCAAEAKTVANCASSKEVCGTDNKTDGVATLSACATEIAAYTTCLSK